MDASQQLAEEYSALAQAYAQHWAPVIAAMAQPLLGRLPLAGAARILDVGSGTGTWVAALRAAAPRASLVGIDRAEGMLQFARRATGLSCAVMDAQRLGFGPQVFDAAILVFVLFHLPDPPAALREVHRVLRPGGFAGVVTWGEDPGLPGFAAWKEELDAVGAAPDPRHASVMQHGRMDTPEKLAALLEQAGFTCDQVWCERCIHAWTTSALFAVQSSCGMAGRRLASLSELARAECQRRVRERLARFDSAALIYRPTVICAVARRPT